MKGLRFLFRRLTYRPAIVPVFAAVLAGMAAVLFIFHEEPGSEDYIFCKFVGAFMVDFGVTIAGMFINMDIAGNRVMRSSPIAGELYGRSVPVFSAICACGSSAVFAAAYLIFILATGRDLVNVSDMLVLMGAVNALMIPYCSLSLVVRWGNIILIYSYFPMLLIWLLLKPFGALDGFGLPLWAGALISAGLCAAGLGAALAVCRLAYIKLNFKPAVQPMTSGAVFDKK